MSLFYSAYVHTILRNIKNKLIFVLIHYFSFKPITESTNIETHYSVQYFLTQCSCLIQDIRRLLGEETAIILFIYSLLGCVEKLVV